MIQGESSGLRRVPLGTVSAFPAFPAPVEVEGHHYFLVRSDDGFTLLSRVCPHKGGRVGYGDDTAFECPQHGWRFDTSTGACLNAPNRSLASHSVEVRDGELFAVLRQRPRAATRRVEAPEGLSFHLHAHACLEIDYRGFSLLTDPWLAGPAFFGSWAQYPPPQVDAATLEPDAIWISHEHSDHFHEQTLRLFPRDVPVYVPDFPNERLPVRLARLGFTDVRPLPFGERREIAPTIALTCFEPASLWNDAIVLVEIDGFRYLNLNDAGVNHRIAAVVAPVDLISSTFSPGASGFPLTWRHIDERRQVEIMERSRRGSLEMLRQAAHVYHASAVLPFASFFALWHPQHRRFLGLQRRNSPADVVDAFADLDVEVVDLVPGESWEPATGGRTPRPGRDQLFRRGEVIRWAKQHFDAAAFDAAYPPDGRLDAADVDAHLLRLNEVPDIAFCENVSVLLRGIGSSEKPDVEVAFEVLDGRLRIVAPPPAAPEVTIELPVAVLARIVHDDVSWDEAFIGYWCSCERSPDVYHANFWRLLQAPYYRRRPALAAPTGPAEIGADSAILSVLDAHGEPADRLLRRYGLYCVGCQHAPSETIRHAAEKHGLDRSQLERLLDELRLVGATARDGEPATV